MKQSNLLDIVTPDGITLRVKTCGEGDLACVLIHGTGDGGYIWDEFIQSLDGLCAVTSIDLRGHADSGWGSENDYCIKTYAADVMHVLKELGLRRMILIGHSMGGDIALRVATLCQSTVVGLVLIDTGPVLDGDGMAWMRTKLKEGLRQFHSESDYLDWLIETRPLASQRLLEKMAGHALRSSGGMLIPKIDPALVVIESKKKNEELSWKMLRSISCPVLVVRGMASAILRREVAEKMVRTLQNGKLFTVKSAGHAVMIDNPEEFALAVVEFVEDINNSIAPEGRSGSGEKVSF